MAQLDNNQAEQPGMDDEKEGKEAESSSLYPLHKFRIEDLSEALYIEIKNKKTKRVFSNSFSKSTLESMKLNGSISKIIHMINSAKSGKHDKFQFSFELLFGDPENDKMTVDDMAKSYSSGCCMYMVISVDEFFMSGVWPFKLLEKKREETDRLKDMIEDLQDELKEARQELEMPRMNPMAIWKSTKATGNEVRWDVETMPPTLQGLATRENNNEDIVIGVDGWYRISIRFGWNGDSGAVYTFHLRLNRDKDIAIFRQYYSIGFTMNEIVKLKKGDKLDFRGSSYSNWTPEYNNFTLELLKKEK